MSHFDVTRVILEEVEPADVAIMSELANIAARVQPDVYRELDHELKLAVSSVAHMQYRFIDKYRKIKGRDKPIKTYTLPRNVVVALHTLCTKTTFLEGYYQTQLLQLIDKKI